MKRQMKTAAALLLGLLAMTACKDNKKEESAAASIEATESGVWHYFSLTAGQEIGTGKEADDNAAWFARTDWDFAVNRYNIRTNSGEATTAGAKGGVYTFAENVAYANAVVPEGATFATDRAITSSGMGGETTVIKSEATVILFKKNEDGSTIMPPVYLKAPVYAFRTADGLGYYKVEFLGYQNDDGKSGYVTFNYAKMN